MHAKRSHFPLSKFKGFIVEVDITIVGFELLCVAFYHFFRATHEDASMGGHTVIGKTEPVHLRRINQIHFEVFIVFCIVL